MNKELVLSFLLALGVVGGGLYALARFGGNPPAPAPAPAPATTGRAISGPVINPCPGGKMLQGECHVPKPGEPGVWIRLSDLNRPKPVPVATMNVAPGGVTQHERQRLAEFDQQQRIDMAERDQRIREQLAQQTNDQAECANIDKAIAAIDATTRRPLSASEQDFWREKRKGWLDAKFRLRC